MPRPTLRVLNWQRLVELAQFDPGYLNLEQPVRWRFSA